MDSKVICEKNSGEWTIKLHVSSTGVSGTEKFLTYSVGVSGQNSHWFIILYTAHIIYTSAHIYTGSVHTSCEVPILGASMHIYYGQIN